MTRRWQYPSWANNDPEAMTRPEVTTPDKWWVPFSEPVLQHAGKLAFAAVIASGIAPIDSDALTRPEVTSLDKWYQPLSEPVLVQKPTPVAAYPSSWVDSDLLTRPEATSLDKWFIPLAEPVPPPPGIEQALISSGNIFFTDEGDLDLSAEELSWYRNLGGIGVEKGLRLSGPTSFPVPPIEEVAEEITLDKWYAPLSQPVLVKAHASEFPTSTNDTEGLTQPEVTSLDKWWSPLSEFLHRDKRSAAALEPASIIDPDLLTRPEETLVSKWVPQTSEPVRLKARLLTALQEAFFVDANIAAVPPAEEITLDKWYQPHSEPVRVKPRASSFPEFTIDTEGLTFPEVTSLDKWFAPLSEPVRVQPTSLAGLLADTDYIGEPTDVEPLAEFMGWFKGLDEPVLPLVLPISHYPAIFYEGDPSTFDPTAERLAWYVDLSLPTLPKVRVAEFPAYVIDPELLTQPEFTSIDKWWRELSEPVRVKARFLESLNQNVTDGITPIETITIDKWYASLSEPVRVKKSSITGTLQYFFWNTEIIIPDLDEWYTPFVEPFFVIDPTTPLKDFFFIDPSVLGLPENITLDKWWQGLSEPLRIKAKLLEALQLHYITDITFDIAEIITLDKWYTPLDEPVRVGDRLVVPFRLPASVGREYQVAVIPIKGFISKEAEQTHVSKEADQTHTSKEADQTKDSKRC